MEYKIKIDEFEGPLDLLLHLIKESNIDIYDIKISEITEQYLDYIKAMEQLNLSIASEYLVMAAELIEIKSKSLLPSKSEDENDEFEEDPKEILIRRLIDYKHYKEITATFKELEQERSQIFTKLPSNVYEYKDDNTPRESQSVSLLLDAFASFLEGNEYKKPIHTKITTSEVSVSERISKIRNILNIQKESTFESLFDEWSREYIVATFLAILQMAKEQEIIIDQKDSFNHIYIKLRGSA